MRFAFQLLQRDYNFDRTVENDSDDDKENRQPKDKAQRKKKATPVSRVTTFEPSDVLTLVPVVRSTAPTVSCASRQDRVGLTDNRSKVSVAEEIFEAGRATINRGDLDLGLEFLLESVQLYENIHSVIHPEVAAAYNQYSSTVHQLARLKISQVTDPEQPLGLDVSTALRLQRQAVIIAERTLGVWHADTLGYYSSLAMLENLEGDAQGSLRYFRHVLEMWEVIHGPGHPEIPTVLVSGLHISLAGTRSWCSVADARSCPAEQRRGGAAIPLRARALAPAARSRPLAHHRLFRPRTRSDRPDSASAHTGALPVGRRPHRAAVC